MMGDRDEPLAAGQGVTNLTSNGFPVAMGWIPPVFLGSS
jgi:hypothetical protein